MRIAFVGDVHGCVYHCLAALVRLHRDARLDAVIQVGDLGAWPDRQRMFDLDPVSVWFAEDNPAQLDWFDLLDAETNYAGAIRAAREELDQPIFFIRGNHDDAEWLRTLELEGAVARADPFDVFHFVPDATVMEVGELRIGFLGGIECDPTWPANVRQAIGMHAFHDDSVARMGALQRGSVDVLVTHDGPHGVATNWRGLVQGAPTLTELEKHLRPRWHVAGHYHHLIGPESRGSGSYLGLCCLVHPLRSKWGGGDVFDPSGAVQPSSIAVLDTDESRFVFPSDAAVREIDRSLEFGRFMNV